MVVSRSEPQFEPKRRDYLRMMTLFDRFSEAIVIVTASWMKLYLFRKQSDARMIINR